MPKANLTKALEKLDKQDMISLILFTLYKIKDMPEYSTLSELAYLLDGNNLLRFLNYYGGMTITIPTAEEFKTVISALLLYNYTNVEGMSYDDAIKLLDKKDYKIKDIKATYIKVSQVLSKYSFIHREK